MQITSRRSTLMGFAIMNNTISFLGKNFRIDLVATKLEKATFIAGSHGYDHEEEYKYWMGCGKIIDRNGNVVLFNYNSQPTNILWPRLIGEIPPIDKMAIITESLEPTIIAPIDFNKTVDEGLVVDFFAAKIIQLIKADNSNLPIPQIELPMLDMSELISKGLAPQSDGQIILAVG